MKKGPLFYTKIYKTFKSGLILGITSATVAACDNGDNETPIAKKTPDTNKHDSNPGPNPNPGTLDLTSEINDLFDTNNLTDGKLPDGKTPAEKLAEIKAAIPAGSESIVKPILESFKGYGNDVKVLSSTGNICGDLIAILKVSEAVCMVRSGDNLIVRNRCTAETVGLTYVYKNQGGSYISKKSLKDMYFGLNSATERCLNDYLTSLNDDAKQKFSNWLLKNIDKLEKYESGYSIIKGSIKSSGPNKYTLMEDKGVKTSMICIINHEGKKLTNIDTSGNPVFA